MSDNVNSVAPETGPATDLSPPKSDTWIRLFWKGFGLAQTIASNADVKRTLLHTWFACPDTGDRLWLTEVEDHVVDQLSLLEEVCGQYETDAIREGARSGYLHVMKTGARRVIPMEVNGETFRGNDGVSSQSPARVHQSEPMGREIPDQDYPRAGSQGLLDVGLWARTIGAELQEDGGSPEDRPGSSSGAPEPTKHHPSPIDQIVRSLVILTHASSELAKEASSSDPRPAKRLAAEVSWLEAMRDAENAYENLERWNGGDQ